ncbi:MAG: hypothetical protein PHP20_10625 [Firmicutes bacterium]|nr:hypothetical protein [Bacillota bacterium]MDD4337740.1 hypothetical protein [Bacillota bacterium]MDD4793504.1 hypothetical protein [Bacillota bacterium]
MTGSFRELIPDTFAEPKEANTWRIEPFNRGFVVDLGAWEASETVRVHARIRIPDDRIESFVLSVASAAIDYCDHMGIELGYLQPSNEGDEESVEPQGEAEDE